MARGLQNYPGVSAPDSDYPNGNIVDGATPVTAEVYSDMHQTLAKVMRETGPDVGTSPNGLPENEYNGFQYVELLMAYLRSYKLRVEYAGVPNPGHMDSILPGSGRRRVFLYVNGMPGNRSLYLPNSTGCTDLIYHRYQNDSSHNLTITPESGDTIDGGLTGVTLTPGNSAEFVCVVANNNWIRVS